MLVRCDFNVPLDKKGLISDDSRIKEAVPTIDYLLSKGAKVILISHLGRPAEIKSKEQRIKNFTLRPIGEKLAKLLKRKVNFLPDCLGEKTAKEINKIGEGEIVLLENLRFYDEEEKNDKDFAKKLAKLGEVYVNEAFSASHRRHASIVGLPKFLPSFAGFLFEREVKVLSKVLKSPWRPLVAIIGGVKIETRIGLIERFLKKADHLLLGGEIANTILIGKGISLGGPLMTDKEMIKKIAKIDITCPRLHLPVDGLISLSDMSEGYFKIGAVGSVKKEEKVFDIGPETIKIFSEIIKQAKMIFWSGPLGLFEEKKFEWGTKQIAENIIRNHPAFKVAGGGDTEAALLKFNLKNRFDYVSTGGGAMLEFLSGKKLPGIEALK